MPTERKFNAIPLARFASTMSALTGAPRPEFADPEPIGEVLDLVKNGTGRQTVDRLVIFNPDAIGEEFVARRRDAIFAPLCAMTDLSVGLLAPFPPKTPVCFATMYSGAPPEVHGIQAYVKPVLKTDTLFDVWARSGKRVALIAKRGQSIPRIFAERDIDSYLTGGDEESVKTGIEVILSDAHEIVVVYNQSYDDLLHATHPDSRLCRMAAARYVSAYARLLCAARSNNGERSTLMTFSPDHGAHRIAGFLLGTHGKAVTSDMNIRHFFTLIRGVANDRDR